jgi:glutamine amidotransferase
MAKVGIVDCGISNLTSVRNAFAAIGADPVVTREASVLADCSHIVLPGVGSFPAGMASLRRGGLDQAVIKESRSGKPVIGLCLGMQLLAEDGEEFEPTAGLGILPGRVVRLAPENRDLRLPHIGWNEVAFKPGSRLGKGLPADATFYFVHSYAYADAAAPMVSGTCDYGGAVAAVIEQDNIMGAQFHPEKSQRAGLALLRNFLAQC